MRGLQGWALLLCLCTGCAEGFGVERPSTQPLNNEPQTNRAMDAGSTPPPSTGAGGGPAVFTGEPCMMGETADCMCSGTAIGSKTCLFDRLSPTMGAFSECRECMEPQSVTPPGDVMTPDAGSGGAGGMSGSGGSSATGGSSAPRPAPTPTPTPTGTCRSPCTQLCFPVGILPCCRTSGPLAGSCGCSWAPGAYCL